MTIATFHPAQWVLAEYSRQWPDVFRSADTFRKTDPDSPWCFMTSRQCQSWLKDYLRTHSVPATGPLSREALKTYTPLGEFIVLAAWRTGKTIIRCDEALLEALDKTGLHDVLPAGALLRLPFWGFYLEFPSYRVAMPHPDVQRIPAHGAFITLTDAAYGRGTDLLAACQLETDTLASQAASRLALWRNWLLPVSDNNPTGNDLGYDDDFQQMRDEVNKLSGADTDLVCTLAEKLLTTTTKYIRVATYDAWTRLHRDGESGLADGLELLAGLMQHFGAQLHPQRKRNREAALEWLGSSRMLDSLSLYPEVTKTEAERIAGALWLTEQAAEQTKTEERHSSAPCTRIEPPKPDQRAQLKRLYLQQSWRELMEEADGLLSRGANHLWLDVQWYLHQALLKSGRDADAAIIQADLKGLLSRLTGLETLAFNDGTPFADEVTLNWIQQQVLDNPAGWQDDHTANSTTVSGDDDILQLEPEALTLADSEGPDAALAWLQSRPGITTPRSRWLLRLLMARIAEQTCKNELALHLLGELDSRSATLTLNQWEPGLLFEVKARHLKLLRMKAGRSEAEKIRLQPEMESLLGGLIAIDPARAAVLCQ